MSSLIFLILEKYEKFHSKFIILGDICVFLKVSPIGESYLFSSRACVKVITNVHFFLHPKYKGAFSDVLKIFK